jgi:hypothetical protein
MVLVDLLAPVAVFWVLRLVRVPEVWALVASGVPPGAGVLVTWRRRGTLEIVGVTVLAGIALSVVLAALSDNPKILLLQDVAFTGVFALCCLASLALPKPLILHFGIALHGGPSTAAGAHLATDFSTYVDARRFWRIVTTVWGIAYLADAGIRMWAVEHVSTGASLTVNRTLPWLITALLFAWAFRWAGRLEQQRDS